MENMEDVGFEGAVDVVTLHKCFGERAQITKWHRRAINTELVKTPFADIVMFSSMFGNETSVRELRTLDMETGTPLVDSGYLENWENASKTSDPGTRFDGMLGPYYSPETIVRGDAVNWVHSFVPRSGAMTEYTQALSENKFNGPLHLPDLFDKATGVDVLVHNLSKTIRANKGHGAVILNLWQNGGTRSFHTIPNPLINVLMFVCLFFFVELVSPEKNWS